VSVQHQESVWTRPQLAEPLISVVVCTLNERRFIGRLIEDVLAQRDLSGEIEMIVADGGSVDGTVEVVRSFADRGVRLVENGDRLAVYGFNLAARCARGRYLAFLGAHARYGPEYLARCLALLTRTRAGNVGGVIDHVGEGDTGAAIAIAMSSPLGLGGPKFRTATRETECESVMGGFLERALFEKLGGFNETNVINQDGEFNYRLRRAGHRVVVSPTIRSTYFVRSTLRELVRQYFRYGFYRRWTQVQHPGSVPLRVYAPPLLIVTLALAALVAVLLRAPWPLLPAACYLSVLAGVSAASLRKARPSVAVRVGLVMASMHLAFGAGWLVGAVRHRRVALSTVR
jgi:glycosyltransferase involved in cell wall biosynthesis